MDSKRVECVRAVLAAPGKSLIGAGLYLASRWLKNYESTFLLGRNGCADQGLKWESQSRIVCPPLLAGIDADQFGA